MKDFGQWLNDQGKGETEEVDDVRWFHCCGCGREEYVSWCEYEAGNSWAIVDDHETDGKYLGVCGGSIFCTP